ncbi:hypothetical protein HHK36_007683 [Tetracentron sinense]|uniref:Stress up-regulated Nod 19 n=1 Tax=Tetracentron sinense TaxID=13715 RepID=A0A835DQC3_TETSI|nr:hypothetical protein HHK36_007683 [Tetracentron sinense]
MLIIVTNSPTKITESGELFIGEKENLKGRRIEVEHHIRSERSINLELESETDEFSFIKTLHGNINLYEFTQGFCYRSANFNGKVFRWTRHMSLSEENLNKMKSFSRLTILTVGDSVFQKAWVNGNEFVECCLDIFSQLVTKDGVVGYSWLEKAILYPVKMPHCSQGWLLSLAILQLALTVHTSQALVRNEDQIKSAVFQSPKFVLGPGSVENKYYNNIEFPRGHIALKEFHAEVVDEFGNPVPLHETYLHHWVVVRYYERKDVEVPKDNNDQELHLSNTIMVRNNGICPGDALGQYFGLGSETRQTTTYVPDPYGIEIGNPVDIPEGYEERWMLNIHAIDTRGVEDRLGCTECRCDLYNVTEDEYGRPLRPDYSGGLYCCYDQTQCRTIEGFESIRRSLYLRYTVKWVDWEDSIVPVNIYIFDVTDTGKRANDSTTFNARHGCQVEYGVESCGAFGVADNKCIDTKKTSLVMPTGGYVIYGVAHQHSGGIGATLYGEDGRVICSSIPIYGKGKEAGNEAGYIVGMSSCYPQPGSVKISDGEILILESNYSSTQKHTGVMGLFYILVADSYPKPMLLLHAPVQMQENMKLSMYSWAVVLLGVAIAIVVGIGYWRRNEREDYQLIAM